jgi:uncharacterized protein (TIGR00369 family)
MTVQAEKVTVYPPQRHIYRHLRLTVDTTQDGIGIGRAPALPDLSGPDGSMRLAVVAAAMDMTAGSLAARLLHPDTVATSSLAIRTWVGVRGGEAVMTCRPLYTGKRYVFMEADLANDQGTSVGTATISFARVTRNRAYDESGAPEGEITSFGIPETGSRLPLEQYVGVRSAAGTDAAIVEAELDAQIRNVTGVLQGAAAATILEAAVLRLASRSDREQYRLADLDINYLTAGKVGPFQARATLIRSGQDHLVARVDLTDEGAEGRLIATGSAAAVIDLDTT